MTQTLMLQGTGSDVGKSVLIAGLCRAMTLHGLTVRPFKPQNMSNNAAVAVDGGEIGRAQWLQALACKAPPSVHMNPVLIKPESDTGAQLIVQGEVAGTSRADDFNRSKPNLMKAVLESFEEVKAGADLVLVEGAGSPAEVNLREGDIANMGFALPTQTPVVLVGDIDRGGVIASLVGTHALLPSEERELVQGFIVNKFRGDMALFDDGYKVIEDRTGWRGYGVVPWLDCCARLPAEDAVVLDRPAGFGSASYVIAVPMLSRIANFDDADPLRNHPEIDLRFIPPGRALPSDADLIILPGTKATIADLRFLKQQGWGRDVERHVAAGKPVLGLCGGYQMLGEVVRDPDGVEGPPDEERGLGLLPLQTVLQAPKTVRSVMAHDVLSDHDVPGYEIHCGQTEQTGACDPFLTVDGEAVGACDPARKIYGAYVHGLFLDDAFRQEMLGRLGIIVTNDVSFESTVDAALDDLARNLDWFLDLAAMFGRPLDKQAQAL